MALKNTHYGAEEIGRMLMGARAIFFIGIGGISMASLAEITLSEGYSVGGSDRNSNSQTNRLATLGAKVFAGHDAAHLDGYDAVIYTVAIGEDNPEYLRAKQSNLPVISRADYLGYIMMRFQTRIGVAGMHGKSTCTAMCSQIFLEAADPTVLCGAELASLGGSTCRIGEAREHFLFEACEYMDSFLDFYPTLAIILNVDLDHVDYFPNIEAVRASFLQYAQKTGASGTVLYNADDKESVRSLESFTGKQITFGIFSAADYRARNVQFVHGKAHFELCHLEECLCRIELPLTGMHNVYNALAAATAAILCGIKIETIVHALAGFCGAGRRMERKGVVNGAVVYDDYGHHPVEIKATLAAAKEMEYKRILCAYQPHTYSRTAGLWQEFSTAFSDADKVFLVDIYAAREQNIYGVSSDLLSKKIGKKATYCSSFSALADTLAREARAGDLVIVMGAGDIYKTFSYLPFE